MKKHLCLALLFLGLTATAPFAAAQEQPTIYTIVPGDTLWGLSQRFLKDPYYWPNVWANNQTVGNPHFIYPGQKVRIYSDRIEIEPAPASAPAAQTPAQPDLREEPQPVTFSVNGSEGFLIENGMRPSGTVISLHQSREMAGTDDIVYTDIGRVHGANPGDRYQVFKKIGPVSHPVTNVILGQQVVPLGELQLSELEDKASKAIVTKSFQEISAGSFLLPYQERKLTIPLKSADRDLTGYIVQTQTGNQALAVSDVVFLDLGKAQGVQPGNMLYIVRDVVPDQRYANAKIEKLPVEVVGALVVVNIGMNSSTAVIVKSVDTIYRGDRVEMKKSR
ncbi:LysM peptidoglycan-binding domain-containing protein [Geomonas azotofigens]|uniref:LysM peptidoglycan-binding domain-containing protein n=1 Tax=Geomonas azotofigens TaxID=2843196 RepID=UPI001C120DE1|nr:LysM peptidoglycan-binding domain-containing protein [Geomonas azotofigens]MBU5612710.1 LysM peptidoglycan-binding domain-containing protein [Geomonas azotofigens]